MKDNWQTGLVVACGIAVVATLLLFKLGSLVHGLSNSEYMLQQAVASDSLTPQWLLRSPLYLPYYVALYLVQLGPFHGPTAIRGVSMLFGLLGAIGFFYILNKWYTLRMAAFGTVLFASSSWFLHAGRFAAPEASYLLLPLLIAGVIHLQGKARSKPVLVMVAILGLLSIYIPGLLWFIIPAVILERRIFVRSLRVQPLWFTIALGLLATLLLAPLLITFVWPYTNVSRLHEALELIGLPSQLPSLHGLWQNGLHLVSNIFAYNTQGPLYVPGHLPLLDACTGALVAAGIYQFALHFRLDRTKLIAIVGVVGALLITSGGPVPIVLLLPFLYLLAVEGLKWLLDLWLNVFPRNPVARSFGIAVVMVLVAVTSLYHFNRYFLAWGYSPETRAVFDKLP